ncbi:MAG: tetratricopeptide repeat protein, partial [Bacteroidota bacterium]
EKQINQALNTLERQQGKNNNYYAIGLNNKAMLFQKIGRYAEAEKLMQESLDIALESMRERSNNYQRLLVNLALLYQDQQKYEQADKIYAQAIRLKERRLGNRNHPDLAHMLNLQASLYMEMGKTEEVEKLLKEALRIYEVKFGKDNPAYAQTASNLGNFYRIQGRNQEAETNLKAALDIRLATLGDEHPDFARAQEDMALLYWQTGKIKEASTLFREVIKKSGAFIQTYFPPMSEVEKEKYWDQLRPTYLRFYAFASQNSSQDPKLLVDMYNAHLATKAILLSASNKIRQQILDSKNEDLIKDYTSWVNLKENLAQLYTYSKDELAEQQINLDSMENAANNL